MQCTCSGDADGLSADIARYSSKYRPESKDSKASLAMVMSLDPYYFPEELYTTKERKYALHQTTARLNVQNIMMCSSSRLYLLDTIKLLLSGDWQMC